MVLHLWLQLLFEHLWYLRYLHQCVTVTYDNSLMIRLPHKLLTLNLLVATFVVCSSWFGLLVAYIENNMDTDQTAPLGAV